MNDRIIIDAKICHGKPVIQTSYRPDLLLKLMY